MNLSRLQEDLVSLSNSQTAAILMRFFKTGPGQYGEGDVFRGIKVPQIRKLVKTYKDLSLKDTLELLHSPYHEDRLCALLIMVKQSQQGLEPIKKVNCQTYLSNTAYINNWDLIDLSAEHVVGAYLFDKSHDPLYNLVSSKSLWERRISILSTFHFIKKNVFSDTLLIAESLLNDKEDLIHKAIGWMLREIGKRDRLLEEQFIIQHYNRMPRTTLRYAIEHFPEEKRKRFLKGNF